MACRLADVMCCGDVMRNALGPYLDLYDAAELAAAFRKSKHWTRRLPWYQELYWISPGEYVRMRMDLPHWTFRSVRKLHLSWWFEGELERDEALLNTFASHMQWARKYLPSLESVVVWLNLTGIAPDNMDPHDERVRALVYFLKGVSHVREIILDLRDTTELHNLELKEILRGCFDRCSHTSVGLALRSTTPSLTESWCKSHEADGWSILIADRLSKFKQQFLHSLHVCIEVPKAGRAEIRRAARTSLKVSSSVARALHQQVVKYICDGKAVLKDVNGMPLRSGCFYAEMKNGNFIELWDNENSARTARRSLLPRNHAGRQHFTPAPSSFGGLGSLSVMPEQALEGVPPLKSGVAALADVLKSLPSLCVTLEGSGFRSPSLQALKNVQIQPNQFEDENLQDDTSSSSSSEEDTSFSSSTTS